MDDETRRARRRAAHTTLASRHPYWELYGRTLLLIGAGAVLVFIVVSLLVKAAGSASDQIGGVDLPDAGWLWAGLGIVLLVIVVWAVARLRDPLRMPRRYR